MPVRLRIEDSSNPGVELGSLEAVVLATGCGRTLLGTPAVDPDTGIELTASDGERWLRALQESLAGSGDWMTTTLEETATMSDGEVVAMRLSVDRELRDRGILRGDGPLSGAYAEYLASKYLGIRLQPNLVNRDFDGVDQDGQRVQIKARVVDTIQSSTSWDYHQPPAGFDVLLAFLFDYDLNVLAVFKMPVSLVAKLARPNRGRWSFRWNRALAKDARVTVVPWPA